MIKKFSLTLVSTMFLGGCAGLMSGLPGSSGRLSCAAPDGVACQSVSGNYINSLMGRLPAQQDKKSDVADNEDGDHAHSTTKSDTGKLIKGRNHTLRTLTSGSPLREEPKMLRIWVAPWEDNQGDLHDQHYVYTVVNQGKWLLSANQQRIRSQFRPVYPLKGNQKDSEPGNKGTDTAIPTQQQTEPLGIPQPSDSLEK